MREQGYEYAPGRIIPDKCQKLRTAFEKACPASWVSWLLALHNTFHAMILTLSASCQLPKAYVLQLFNSGRLSFLQVRHFDELQEKNARLSKQLHRNINQSANKAAGSLAGKA